MSSTKHKDHLPNFPKNKISDSLQNKLRGVSRIKTIEECSPTHKDKILKLRGKYEELKDKDTLHWSWDVQTHTFHKFIDNRGHATVRR